MIKDDVMEALMSYDLRPLANELNSWLASEEAEKLKKAVAIEGAIELLSYRDGGYRQIWSFTEKGIAWDFYPVVQPKLKGDRVQYVSDSLRLFESLLEEGEYKSLKEMEADLWKKLRVEK